MSEIRENLESILRKTADGLHTGNTNLDECEMEFLLNTFNEVTSPDISTYTAIKLSGYSKSEFYKLVSDGLLPKGYHVQGYKEIRYNKERLLKALEKLDRLKKKSQHKYHILSHLRRISDSLFFRCAPL